jgi:hypothetical protein
MSDFTLFKNHPDPDVVAWTYLDKKTYLEIEQVLSDNVVFFKPFLVDNFYPKDMFEELVNTLTSHNLEKINYSNQMNKWEQSMEIPKRFIDYAIQKVGSLIGTNDIQEGYHMYAHHQIDFDGREPRLPLHIDWSPGSYMLDLHIGGNRDWAFVAGFDQFVCKPNQAIICQPQFDYHYRPSWDSKDSGDFYQALFFHFINDSHWFIENEKSKTRDASMEKKYTFGPEFKHSDVFVRFQQQRDSMFRNLYKKGISEARSISGLSDIPSDVIPSKNDAKINNRRGVYTLKQKQLNEYL